MVSWTSLLFKSPDVLPMPQSESPIQTLLKLNLILLLKSNDIFRSEPYHSSSENVSASNDKFFMPLVITCGCLAASCLAVVTLLIKFMRKKSSKIITRRDFYNLNNQSTMNLNVKSINTSIEIYEEDVQMPIYTIFGGKDVEGLNLIFSNKSFILNF
jgi:hypothetical protein